MPVDVASKLPSILPIYKYRVLLATIIKENTSLKIIVLPVQEHFTEFCEDDIGKIKQKSPVREFYKSLM